MLADAAVVLEPDAVARDAPLDVALEQELAGREEHVHVVEVRLDEPLAQEEVLRRDRREALVAAPRRSVHAELAVGAHHLAVAVADRQELVQRVEDRRVGKHAPHGRHEVVAEEERVLEVHDVGLVRLDELREVLRVEALVAGGHREEVEVVRLRVEEVLVRVRRRRR